MNFHHRVRTRLEVSETRKGLHHPIYYPRGRGYSREFLVGVCRPVLQILTLFQTKKMSFSARFQTWPLRNDVIITYMNKSSNILKYFLKFISISRISLSFLLLLINTFVNSCSFLESHIQFQTKMAYMACIRDYPPPPLRLISFYKAKTFVRVNWIPNIMDQLCYLKLYLGIQFYWNYFLCRLLQRMATDLPTPDNGKSGDPRKKSGNSTKSSEI